MDLKVKEKEVREKEKVDVDLVMVLYDTIGIVKETSRRLLVALIISILSNIALVGGFLLYESQYEFETTDTYTQQLEASGENAILNKVDGNQYNDSAVHNDGSGVGD